jgi:hypothetical protein
MGLEPKHLTIVARLLVWLKLRSCCVGTKISPLPPFSSGPDMAPKLSAWGPPPPLARQFLLALSLFFTLAIEIQGRSIGAGQSSLPFASSSANNSRTISGSWSEDINCAWLN